MAPENGPKSATPAKPAAARPNALAARLRAMPRARRVWLAVAGLAVLTLLVAVAGSAPAVCAGCHRTYADALAKTAHAKVDCYGCHLPAGLASWPGFKAREASTMYPTAILGRGVTGPGSRVSSGPCAGCHRRVLAGVIEAKGTRIDHRACALGRSCDACHGTVAHGKATRWVRQPVMDDCVRCHIAKKATIGCDACHADKSTRARLAAGPWQVTHGKNWRATHGMGDITVCRVCHPSSKCVTCHGTPIPHAVDFGRTHGELAKAPEARCEGCHDRAAFCTDCHGLPMPHPASFLPGHSKIAKTRQDKSCLKCHYQDDCDACHTAHTHPGNTKGTLKDKLPTPKSPAVKP
jgi:hypothetical protein